MWISLHRLELLIVVLALLWCNLIKRDQFVFVFLVVAAVTVRGLLFSAQQLAVLVAQQALPQSVLGPRPFGHAVGGRGAVAIGAPGLWGAATTASTLKKKRGTDKTRNFGKAN